MGFLFDLPLILTGPALIAVLVGVSILGLNLFRKYQLPRLRFGDKDGEFSAAIVASIMVFYGLATALTAVNVWEIYLKVEEITEILTRDGVATVTYTTTYEQTDLFKKWKESLRYVVGENTPRPEPGKACLQKYDQGWRACER